MLYSRSSLGILRRGRSRREWPGSDSRDSGYAAGFLFHGREAVLVHEEDAIPLDAEIRIGLHDADRPGIAVPGQAQGRAVLRVQQPGVARFGRKEQERTQRYAAGVAFPGSLDDVVHLAQDAGLLAG